jgi:tRNA (Thr-GGU) A37 N-methylase
VAGFEPDPPGWVYPILDIAMSQCDIISVHGNVVQIEEIDAFDGSPVLDLKGDFFRLHKRSP